MFADDLIANGILTVTEPRKSTPPDAALPRPARLISRSDRTVTLIEALPYLPRFARACVVADHSLRFRRFSRLCERIAHRNSKCLTAGTNSFSNLTIRLTHVFHSLRPLYPRPYLCLFDSLALLEFLAQWRVFPHWVFGVSVDPFEAHCWIQDDALVLCDTNRFSSRWFSQIMAI